MKILLSASIGYCDGVRRAIRLAEEATRYGLPVFTLGPIVHNERACADLAAKGVGVVTEEEAIALRDSVLVLRAHGVSDALRRALDSSVHVVDATCPRVAAVRRAVEKGLSAGSQVVLVGDRRHAEMRAVLADYPEVVCVADEGEAQAFCPTADVFAACQTTVTPEKYKKIINILSERCKKCEKSFANLSTICYTTIVRKSHLIHLARRADAVAVIGSSRSANTCALVEICRRYCSEVALVEDARDIGKIKQKISVLGIATGASTPLESVTEVITSMSNEEKALTGEEVEVTVDAAAEVNSAPEEETPTITTMAQALESMIEVKPGAVLKCKVLSVGENGLIVGCGQKKDGFISAENCGVEEYDPANYQVGDTFKAKIIENKDKDKSLLTLSKKAVDQEQIAREARAEAEKELSSGKFEVEIERAVKGGLLGKKGDYVVFIPASHVDTKHVEQEELESYVGKTITVKKLPPKEKDGERESSGKRIVASRKQVLLSEQRQAQAARKKAREERMAREEQEKHDIFDANKDRFEVNNIVPGVVKKFVTFGVFVNVYGFDCLCPSSEISWVRHADPKNILEEGKQYEFLIIKTDPENYKVTLSFKQIQRQPYEVAAEKYPVGTIIRGVVQSIVKFGAFISIEPGVDGLVHKSNISNEKIENPEDVLTVGQEVEAKVISFNDNRIALSIKDVNAPEKAESGERPVRAPRGKRNFDRPAERKPRKPEDNIMSEEEKQNMAQYSGNDTVTNNAFADILKGFNAGEEEPKAEDKQSDEDDDPDNK